LTVGIELSIIEIPKIKRLYKDNNIDKIGQWMLFLDDPNSKEVLKIMDENKNIKDAREELEAVSGDYEIRRIAELKEKAIRDEISIREYAMKTGIQQGLEEGRKVGMKEGRKEGIKEGIKEGLREGRKEEKVQIAKNMLLLNVGLEIISKTTGLSKEEILKLKQ